MRYKYSITIIPADKHEFYKHVTKEAVDGWEILSVAPCDHDARWLITWRQDQFPNGAAI